MSLSFIGLGAQKCASTWLYTQLSQHPEIYFPGGKEIHFWDNKRHLGLEWYRNLFDNPMKQGGDITPAYAVMSRDIIKEVHGAFPHVKLLYIVRDPGDRAWSAALMRMHNRHKIYENTPDEWFIKDFLIEESLKRGNYETCLKNWLHYYNASQLLVMFCDDIEREPRKVLGKCAHILGINDQWPITVESMRQKIFQGPSYPLRPSLKVKLSEIYGHTYEAFKAYCIDKRLI